LSHESWGQGGSGGGRDGGLRRPTERKRKVTDKRKKRSAGKAVFWERRKGKGRWGNPGEAVWSF